MVDVTSRRGFLAVLPLTGVGLAARFGSAPAPAPDPAPARPAGLHRGFPSLDPELVQEVVGASHRDVDAVRRLVEHQPSLARASWDWGFGDWETALGAASHTGRRNIAEVLLAHGARPTIFSAAMMGQLDVVKAFVAASPGVQGTPGPHGITLLAHARAGGKDAEPVLAYLHAVGGADARPATADLPAADRDAILGEYAYGSGGSDRFVIDVRNDIVGLTPAEGSRRNLFHTGDLVFFPAGVPSVKIAFAREGGRVTRLTIADPDVFVTAVRR